MDSPRLYVIPIQAHREKASEWCWGSCGHGLIGAVNLVDHGDAIPCITPATECPQFDKEMDAPYGTVHGGINPERPVYLRKLKAVSRG